MSTSDLARARASFAAELRAVAHLTSEPLVAAFARVPREAFLDPGPWLIANPFDRANPYRPTPDADPAQLYHDVVVAIDPARSLNNGQPSALARWIDAVGPRPGERTLHVGCGTGYYTAILAELVGPGGHVAAYEVDAELADRARRALAPWPHVTVTTGDASTLPPGATFDVAFVNAGATHVPAAWIGALAPGGRMFVPLTIHVPGFPHGIGLALRIAHDGERWPITIVSQVGIYDCAGARDPAIEAELAALADPAAQARLRALCIAPHARGPACLVHVPGACLQA